MARRRLALVLAGLCIFAGLVGIRQANGGPFDHTIAMSGDPVAVAVDSQTQRAFVINGADFTVSVIDTVSGEVIRSVAIGTGANTLAVVDRTNRVFVPNTGDNTVSILDARSGLVRHTVALGYSPSLIAVNHASGRVYVTNTPSATLSILDGSSGALLHTVPLRSEPLAMAVNTVTGRLFIAAGDNTVQARDAETGKLLHTTSVGGFPAAIGVDPRTSRVFVADPTHAAVKILDGRTGAVLRVTHVAKNPIALVTLNTLGRVAVASLSTMPNATGPSVVSILDAGTGQLLQSLPISAGPQALAADDRDGAVLVDVGTAILEIDVTTGVVTHSLPVLGIRFTGQAMAVDTSTGHLFIVNSDNSNPSTNDNVVGWVHQWLPWLPHRVPSPYGSISEYDARQ
jgi:YVTN family beta-propeller protein